MKDSRRDQICIVVVYRDWFVVSAQSGCLPEVTYITHEPGISGVSMCKQVKEWVTQRGLKTGKLTPTGRNGERVVVVKVRTKPTFPLADVLLFDINRLSAPDKELILWLREKQKI